MKNYNRFKRLNICLISILSLTAGIALFPFIKSLAAAGDLDPTFGFGGKVITDWSNPNFVGAEEANDMAIQADGKIVVVGEVKSRIRDPYAPLRYIHDLFAVIRYNPDGSLDRTFNHTGKVTTEFITGARYSRQKANAVAIQPDGKIVAAGLAYESPQSDPYSGVAKMAVARYNRDGSLDKSFDEDGKVIVDFNEPAFANNLAIQSDGKIVVVGSAVENSQSFSLVRLNSNGSLDNSFDGDGKVITEFGIASLVYGLAIQPDGKIVAAGDMYTEDFNINFAVARYNPDGSLDTSFDGDGKTTADFAIGFNNCRAAAIQTDGRIVVAGLALVGEIFRHEALIRYNRDGSPDITFGGDGKVTTPYGDAADVVIQTDGKIVTAGFRIVDENTSSFGLVRYHTDGSLDGSFGTGGTVLTQFTDVQDYATSLAIQSDGKIVAAGTVNISFSNEQISDFGLARYLGE
jgi:uncharacterized delta-60 repeat protein